MKQLKKLLTTRNNNWLIQYSSGKHYIVHNDFSIRKYDVCINK